jgi:hypothetical protein
MKNRAFAIDAAPSAIPPNPKIAATIAMMKKVIDQRNITQIFYQAASSSGICRRPSTHCGFKIL